MDLGHAKSRSQNEDDTVLLAIHYQTLRVSQSVVKDEVFFPIEVAIMAASISNGGKQAQNS